MKLYLSFFLLLFTLTLTARDKKKVEALYISTPLSIDGVLDEDVYSRVSPAKDFVQLQPFNGKPSFQPSEAYFFYDQTAIYVGAMLYDSSPDSIFNFLTARDDIGMSDYFGVYIDPYNEGQLAYGFFTTPAGVQTDIKAVKSDDDNEDGAWDAVWESKTRITDKGWIVEMRIPYSALRFAEKDVHTWGLNMFRNIRRYNSNNSWSLVDRKISGFIHQEGELTNIKNIKPPVRLSFSPYIANYIEYKGENAKPEYFFKGGMDAKFGLSESFTLDMMLIPDFGQIQSDDQQLNLSPYELYFDEKRQFFTEGTELFQRGGIFYSRRIGAGPKFDANPDSFEIEDERPGETQLINATKISGRNKSGWGLGMLNAMSIPSYSTIKDTLSGASYKELVQPFTNYNVAVVDKTLKNNGYFSLINTNISMANNSFRANVTATEFQIRNKAKTYAIKGKGGLSNKGSASFETGFFGSLGIAKNSGNLTYGITQNVYSDKFDPNDLGYLQRNNEVYTESFVNYKIIEPFWIVREWNFRSWQTYRRMYIPNDYSATEIGVSTSILFKNNYSFYMNSGTETDKRDYFETRVLNRYYFEPQYFWFNYEFSTDQRKPLRLYLHNGGYLQPGTNQHGYWGAVGLYCRIGQRFQAGYDMSYNNEINDRGYIDKNNNEDSIYFAIRNVTTFLQVIEASYALNNKTSFRVRMRHYWSGAINKNYYILQDNGSLNPFPTYPKNKNENLNTFNIDWGFRWTFAPGSELTISWKNSIYNQEDQYYNNRYWENLNKTWHINQNNTISLKILYYIDYNNLRPKQKNAG